MLSVITRKEAVEEDVWVGRAKVFSGHVDLRRYYTILQSKIDIKVVRNLCC